MKTQTCILCGLPLSDEKTNREHYVPQTLIRNFGKLGVPATWTHALRVNSYGAFSNSRVLPIGHHREWATVEVHERCNLDASPMCQDLKWWIDNPGALPSDQAYERVLSYYGRLWSIDPGDLCWGQCQQDLGDCISGLTYEPGHLQVGWMFIGRHGERKLNDQHFHTIYLGTIEGLEDLIK